MRRLIYFLCFAAAALFLCSGCLSTDSENVDKKEAEMKKCGEQFVLAFLKGDEKEFFSCLPAGIVSRYGHNEFTENRAALFREFGDFESIRFLTMLETPSPLHTCVWVVRFRRPAVIGERKIEQEVLCRVVFGEVDGHYQIYSFSF